ncbi:MAG: gualylate cyclase [Myxococcales bacterium]|nr:gualylate cyclase [Myxococcales bacterium]
MRFIDIHKGMNGVDRPSFEEAHRKDTEIQGEEGVQFLHVWADPATGTAFCLSEGPDKEAVLRVHAKAGHPTDEIYEVSIEAE